MSYQVLARKWRPQTFADVVGQEHVLTALANGLSLGRIHHAYLFSGTRGVGKTSIARLLAKGLNCETGITATPCGVCDNCREIEQGRFVDLIEIDAASRTKVEDTRDLLATGGTIEATVKLIRRLGGEVADAAFIINLFDLGGEQRLEKQGITSYSLVPFPGH